MNPWGLLFIGLGLVLIVIGFKGSQHTVIDAFKGIRNTQPSLQDSGKT